MEISLPNISRKMSGKVPFTPKQKARLVEVLDAPIEYLLARNDG